MRRFLRRYTKNIQQTMRATYSCTMLVLVVTLPEAELEWCSCLTFSFIVPFLLSQPVKRILTLSNEEGNS